MERRLSAILAADMVGFSRRMEADEAGTLADVKTHREGVIAPCVDAHNGRVVKLMGDGILVEFASVVDAVGCAVDIQAKTTANGSGTVGGQPIQFRVGINLGDVIVDGDDIYGDGVNVAARLEAIAEPGGIYISGKVYDEVKNKLDFAFRDLGEQQVKNISQPVRVYQVSDSSAPGNLAQAKGADERPALPDNPSIAVLPFENMSGDAEQEYFADGISEDIITALSKISHLFVIARNSTFTYKGTAVNVPQVSRELGVRFVLEGSVRKAGNRVRITAQLIDGNSGGHVWADRYDRDLTDIFAVQDEVTHEIVTALTVQMTPDETARLAHKGTDNLEAYDLFLRGREQLSRQTREANAEAASLIRRAIELDPNFAVAHAALARNSILNYVNQWSGMPDQALDEAEDSARKAISQDSTEPKAHFSLGLVLQWRRRPDEAIAEAERTLALDPNSAESHILLGHILIYEGRQEEAIRSAQMAMRLDPHYPDVYLHFLAVANFHLGNIEAASDLLKRRLVRKPESDVSRVLLASCYGHLDRHDEARAEWQEVLRINPDYSLEHRRKILPYKDPADFEQIVDGLRKAGIET